MLLSRCVMSACLAVVFLLSGSAALKAQSVQPVISEYTDHAAGWFEVTNNSTLADVVILEPKSFSIAPDGTGEFRFLDSSIHVELSTTSLRLEPQQTARIFYKVTTDIAPAWLCIYASFSPAKKTQGLTVRMMLPHTVYVYQRLPLPKEAVDVGKVWYDSAKHIVHCELTNNSSLAGRAQAVEVVGGHATASLGGFPMLPHMQRILSVDWTSGEPPRSVEIIFDRFSLKHEVDLAGAGDAVALPGSH